MKLIIHCFVVNLSIVLLANNVLATSNNPFDLELYENVLDPEQCQEQLTYINDNSSTLAMQFMDASFRVPRSLLKGNTRDLGNYFQCLDISEDVGDMSIRGKFSIVNFPLDQPDLDLPSLPFNQNDQTIYSGIIPNLEQILRPKVKLYTEEYKRNMFNIEQAKVSISALLGDIPPNTTPARSIPSGMASLTFELALCIPQVCTPKEVLDFVIPDMLNIKDNLNYTELFVRLPNDKTWVAADTVAIVLLSIIGLITIISTVYDINHTVILERDPKAANKICQSFSIYTNTKNFFIFPSGPSLVTCLDGVRSFAMMWVIIGHTFVTQLTYIPENPLDIIDFITKFSALWITSATITVDTFFLISGLLVVYTTAAKVSSRSLIRNLHLFYINRVLRMFPILAFGVLWTASFLHRLADGPYFTNVEGFVTNCRTYWWSTLLYVQNFVNPQNMCVPHSWYLAIDMQLHFFSPVVLFWVLGKNKTLAWLAMVGALVGFIAGASVYNFINEFQSAVVALSRPGPTDYMTRYYVHTLPRAAPFFVGMIFGYMLHLYRAKKPRIPVLLAICLWVLAMAGILGVISVTYWNIQPDWDNQLMDNLLNSYKRPIWAASVGWIIFACHNGYGGPANWVLSLHVFKILGRLSYAMYILHYPLIYLINGTTLSPIYFSVRFSILRFFIDFSLALMAAFVVTILIDFPFANLIKMAIGPGPKKPAPKENPSLQNDLHPTEFTSKEDSYEKKTRV